MSFQDLLIRVNRTESHGPRRQTSRSVDLSIKYWSIEHFEPDRDDLINGRITWSPYHQSILYLDSKQDVEGYWGTSRKATAVKKINIDQTTASYG